MPLFIVGLGIKARSHITEEAKVVLKRSNKIFYLSHHKEINSYLESLNHNCFSLSEIYFSNEYRKESYKAISDRIIHELSNEENICLAIYGHPTFFVQPSTYIAQLCKKKGIRAHILPGISSIDCLMADFNINPGSGGLQVYDCTELLVDKKVIDVNSNLILMQPSVIGNKRHKRDKSIVNSTLGVLQNYLIDAYQDSNTPIYIYRAARSPEEKAVKIESTLSCLRESSLHLSSSLYIPPKGAAERDVSMSAVLKKLND